MDTPTSPSPTTIEPAPADEPKAVIAPAAAGEATTAAKPPKAIFGVPLVFLIPSLALLMLALGVGVGYLLWGRASNTDSQKIAAAVKATQKALNPPPQNIKRYDVPVENNPALGPADAPITIIEFSDYECPYCRKWAQEVFHPLLEAYPNQIRFVYRDFPLTNMHAEALPAAEAASCANEQGKYWEFQEKLFDEQLGKEAYRQYATELGLDMTKFDDCVNSNRYQDEVMSDYTWAANFGVESTPTFFVNGIPIVGAQPLEVFTQLIDWEMAGELPK